jgi:hypothetical protein
VGFPATEFFKMADSVLGAPPRPSPGRVLGAAALGGGAALLGAAALGGAAPHLVQDLTGSMEGAPPWLGPGDAPDEMLRRHFEEIDRMPTLPKPGPHQIY